MQYLLMGLSLLGCTVGITLVACIPTILIEVLSEESNFSKLSSARFCEGLKNFRETISIGIPVGLFIILILLF